MYDVIKTVILSRNYELKEMLHKINVVWVSSDLTDEQYTELVELAQNNADMSYSIDVLLKLEELDRRVTAIENKEGERSDEYPEYVAGKWYYRDDKITFNGKHYKCIAPEGQVCTWSPDEYPVYWEMEK